MKINITYANFAYQLFLMILFSHNVACWSSSDLRWVKPTYTPPQHRSDLVLYIHAYHFIYGVTG